MRLRLTLSTGRPWRVAPVDVSPGVPAGVGPLTALLEISDKSLTLTWRNEGTRTVRDVAAGLLLELPTDDAYVTIPGVLYNGNPSSDPALEVPRSGFVCEEHRLPIPAVNAAWDGQYVTLYAQPVARRAADGTVAYGSLGILDGPVIAAMSGVIMFDGRPDVCYTSKAETTPMEIGYADLAPGASITSRYRLDTGRVEPRGFGFRALVKEAVAEEGARPLTIAEIIRLKANALDARWDPAGGYLAYASPTRPRPRTFLYGWTGQCLKLAWCDARLGRPDRAFAAAEFYVSGSGTPVPGLRHGRYLLDEERWAMFDRKGQPFVSSRAYGETIADLALLAEEFGEWTEAVVEAAEFFWRHGGILPLGWTPSGTPVPGPEGAAGIPCARAMLGAHRLTGDKVWLRRAAELVAAYHRRHAETFERPFAHATLDASGEDKEAGMAYFEAVTELFQLTGDDRYARWAEAAADWLLTFVYTWSPEFDADSTFHRRGFKASGWPAVSVQNHHLDVFFPTAELRHFGLATGNDRYVAAADRIMHALGQGICREPGDWGFATPGEQGEGFFQTNWQRKGEANTWNPSWVIALPLYHALRWD
ncbi:hypothetical protein OHA25_37060 [Nonomuraea sp. NBC_00507]|uniref:hypothetical protein n=1 Tax=Nonomuraea sp. NBC_00507 TaxID=2976002 RepID=UPI002E18D080